VKNIIPGPLSRILLLLFIINAFVKTGCGQYFTFVAKDGFGFVQSVEDTVGVEIGTSSKALIKEDVGYLPYCSSASFYFSRKSKPGKSSIWKAVETRFYLQSVYSGAYSRCKTTVFSGPLEISVEPANTGFPLALSPGIQLFSTMELVPGFMGFSIGGEFSHRFTTGMYTETDYPQIGFGGFGSFNIYRFKIIANYRQGFLDGTIPYLAGQSFDREGEKVFMPRYSNYLSYKLVHNYYANCSFYILTYLEYFNYYFESVLPGSLNTIDKEGEIYKAGLLGKYRRYMLNAEYSIFQNNRDLTGSFIAHSFAILFGKDFKKLSLKLGLVVCRESQGADPYSYDEIVRYDREYSIKL
jgi:hypothetical protein